MKYKRIISCAITGAAHTPSMSPYLPITPDQIAQNALDAANAGAAVVHLHARNPENGMPSSDPTLFEEIITKIRTKNKDLLICLTTGGAPGMSFEERLSVIPTFKPELASMNSGTMNWAVVGVMEKLPVIKYEWEKILGEQFALGGYFQNTFADIKNALETMNKFNCKPELEVYDVGHIYNLTVMKDMGLIQGKPYLQFVMGVVGGIAANNKTLLMMKDAADDCFSDVGYEWSALGTGKNEYPICTQNILLGGHCRVGMEDNLFLSKGQLAKNNGELVQKMVNIISQFDLEPATPDEAREILGIKK